MALVGLSEAARITGRNRTTIFRAMKSGRLSFTTNGAGERQVDVAELERVFAATDAEQPKSDATHVAVLGAQLDAERRQNALLERTRRGFAPPPRRSRRRAAKRADATERTAGRPARSIESSERFVEASDLADAVLAGCAASISSSYAGRVSSALLQPAPHCASSSVG